MKTTRLRFTKIACAIIVGMAITHGQLALAGWTGIINGVGVGWASVNVRSATLQTNRVTTINNFTNPSAAMSPTTGYVTNAPSPRGSATNTYSRIKGLSGGIWQASANAANGDGTDNPELEQRIAIDPADCASLIFDSKIDQSQAAFNTNGNTGTISVNASATAGTALWLRGYEYTGSMADVPPDDPGTVVNESIEYLKIHGTQKFETLILGPFEFGGNNCPLIVPFSLNSGNLENLIIAADGVAKSNPLWIGKPDNIAVVCGTPVIYNPVSYSGCGEIAISFNPPPGTLFPVGITKVVVTAADSFGSTANTSFTVTVFDNTAPVAPVLMTLTNESSVQVPTPTADDTCAATKKTVTGTTTDPTFYNTQGTFTVHWKFDDDNGNVSYANQTVIIDDVTPPVPPVIPDATGQCSVTLTAPTATDNVAGTITGTTSSPLTITAQGTNIVTWTFNDGNGNTSTATQKAIVKDTIVPLAPVLPGLTNESAVQVPTPTANDNCAGTVTGTTADPTSYNTQGTNIVHWSFNDGNGNVSYANQTVIVKDVTPPVPPTIPDATGQCSVTLTAPTAIDNVAGTITGTTGSPLTITTQGTNIVTWTFNDGNGNSSTTTQKAIVKDTIAPVAPVLGTVVSGCLTPVTLTAPNATDNCAGIVTGATTTIFPITALGTTVVTWTFNDGNGNTSTATQNVTIPSITFTGFYSPIMTVSNLCTSPVVVNQGSVCPIKFDVLCGTTVITGGQPPIVKIQLWTGCAYVSEPISVDAVYQNNWHYNWDTSGWAKGIYKVIVVLQNGTTQYVFIQLK